MFFEIEFFEILYVFFDLLKISIKNENCKIKRVLIDSIPLRRFLWCSFVSSKSEILSA